LIPASKKLSLDWWVQYFRNASLDQHACAMAAWRMRDVDGCAIQAYAASGGVCDKVAFAVNSHGQFYVPVGVSVWVIDDTAWQAVIAGCDLGSISNGDAANLGAGVFRAVGIRPGDL